MEPWIWAVMLLALGLALTVVEVFIPSGGIVAFLSACTLIASIVMAFRQGSAMGLSVLTGAMVGVPLVVALGLRWWPKTGMGKRMLLSVPQTADVLPDNPRQRYLKGLVGRVGQAKSLMLPSGAVTIDGRTIDALSEGTPVEPGMRVRVVEVRGNRVVVRRLEDEEPAPESADPLSRPVPDPFEEGK